MREVVPRSRPRRSALHTITSSYHVSQGSISLLPSIILLDLLRSSRATSEFPNYTFWPYRELVFASDPSFFALCGRSKRTVKENQSSWIFYSIVITIIHNIYSLLGTLIYTRKIRVFKNKVGNLLYFYKNCYNFFIK